MIREIAAENSRSVTKLETFVFCALIVLATCSRLPIQATLGLSNPFDGNGFILVIIGALLMFFRHGREIAFDKSLRRFALFVLLGCITTLVMAVILYDQVGTLYGETTLTTIWPSLCWLLFDLVIVIYLCWGYQHIPNSTLDKAMDVLLILVIVVSALELGVMYVPSVFGFLSEPLELWILRFDANAVRLRLCGVADEPSAMSATLGMFCLPYCYSRFRDGGARYIVAFFALLVIAWFTFSTTTYITVGVVLATIAVRELSSMGRRGSHVPMLVLFSVLAVALIGALVFMATGRSHESSDFAVNITKVIGRSVSEEDQSGAYRNSTIANDLAIVREYPLFGVGDGNQGFFYSQNLPNWIRANTSAEVAAALNGERGVLDGGAFIGALLSGYGIVGTCFFAVWAIGLLRYAMRNQRLMGRHYDMYIVALVGSMPVLYMNLGFKGAPVAAFLIFCMPMMAKTRQRTIAMTGGD